jgi:two-component system sensor histidine kinase MprB
VTTLARPYKASGEDTDKDLDQSLDRRWRRRRLWRPLMLRTRFAVTVALVVAVVTLAITAVAFLIVRADLQNQVKQELRARAASIQHQSRRYHGHIPAHWVPPQSGRFGTSSPYTQLVTSGGAVWAPAGETGLLPASTAAAQVAAGQHAAYYSQVTMDGVRAMVLTTQLTPGLAIQLAQPLDQVNAEVTIVGTTLALLSAAGVVLAALAGRAVARAGLAPVGHLAAVAEQVTATGNPAGRVEVDRPDELGRLAASFNTMLRALQRSHAAQRQLVSDASHELRTPLTSLRLNVEMLAASPDLPEPERTEILDRVAAQVAELGDLVSNVTELARGESSAATLEHVDLREVAQACLRAAQRDWPHTPFRAELEPVTVFGSAERLGIAVRNLLDNAAKFSPPGAAVTLRLTRGELTVTDSGPGIAAEDLPHVFDRFYRTLSARAVPGSGLGLSIVRQVAESHGGTATVRSAPGRGSQVTLSLPAAAAQPAAAPGGGNGNGGGRLSADPAGAAATAGVGAPEQ